MKDIVTDKLTSMERKIKIIFIILVSFIIIFLISLLGVNVKSMKIFFNTDGKFDYAILWSAIGAIGSVIAFIGVIITIIFTEKSRSKQNKYEYDKEQILRKQEEFNNEVKKQIEILDPLNVIIIMSQNIKRNEKMNQINTYRFKIKTIDYKIYWYYDDNIYGKSIEAAKFNTQLTEMINFISNELYKYTEINLIKSKLEEKNTLNELKNLTELKQEEKEELNSLEKENLEQKLKEIEQKKQVQEIIQNLVNYRNQKWPMVVETGKRMIYERNEIIKKKLSSL